MSDHAWNIITALLMGAVLLLALVAYFAGKAQQRRFDNDRTTAGHRPDP